MEVAQLAVADQRGAGAVDEVGQRRVVAHERVVLDPARPVGVRRAQLVAVDGGVDEHLGDAGPEVEQRAFDRVPSANWNEHEVIGEDDTLGRREVAVRESHDPLTTGRAHPERQAEVDRELEVHVEELGPQLERAHEPDEHGLVAFDEGGNAEHRVLVDHLGVLRGEGLERVGLVGQFGDGVGVESRARDGATARIQYVIGGGPDGDVKYSWVLENGKLLESHLGTIADPDLTITAPYADWLKIAQGELDTSAAFMG